MGRPKGSKNKSKEVESVSKEVASTEEHECECEPVEEEKVETPTSTPEPELTPPVEVKEERIIPRGKEWAKDMTNAEFQIAFKQRYPIADNIPVIDEWLYRPHLVYKGGGGAISNPEN